MIAKQMDIRANIKKFFDIAYDGEPVIVPRKQNRNVVIISENEYYRLCRSSRLSVYAQAIASRETGGAESPDSIKAYNIGKLHVIRSLKENWNSNGAMPIPQEIANKVESLIENLIIQPEIFPTAHRSIQLEYENSRRDHMEIEIDTSDTAGVFIVKNNGSEIYETVSVDYKAINRKIGLFYS